MINFNYSPFEEDIVIIGKKGTGKTKRAQKILSEIRNLPYWVYDYNEKFTNFGKVCRTLAELEPRTQCIFQPRIKDKKSFLDFCSRVHFEIAEKEGNLVYVIDELHQMIKHKQETIPELQTLIMSDRNKGVSGILISTVHTIVPNWVLTNVTHVFAYRVGLANHLDWLEDYVGSEAWLLFPNDKRRNLIQDPRMIKKHGFVYRNLDLDSPEIEIGED